MAADAVLPPLARDALARYVGDLRARFGARLLDVRVFGSYARGEASEASDLDVFVLLDQMDAADKRSALELAAAITADLDFDLVVSALVIGKALYETWRMQERRLVLDIEREGIRA